MGHFQSSVILNNLCQEYFIDAIQYAARKKIKGVWPCRELIGLRLLLQDFGSLICTPSFL